MNYKKNSRFPLKNEFKILAINERHRPDKTFFNGQEQKYIHGAGYIDFSVYFTAHDGDDYDLGFDYVKKLTDDYQPIIAITDKEAHIKAMNKMFERDLDEAFVLSALQRDEAWQEVKDCEVRAHRYRLNDFVQYSEYHNFFFSHNFVNRSPTTLGIIEEIKLLQKGINYSKTTDLTQLLTLIEALDFFWH